MRVEWYSTAIESTNNRQSSTNKYNTASVHYKSDIFIGEMFVLGCKIQQRTSAANRRCS